jgi:hypothetical protein
MRYVALLKRWVREHYCQSTYISHSRQECHNSKFGILSYRYWKRRLQITFDRYSVIKQFAKLAAGEQLCRRCTYTKLWHFKTFKSFPWKVTNFQLWHFCRKWTMYRKYFKNTDYNFGYLKHVGNYFMPFLPGFMWKSNYSMEVKRWKVWHDHDLVMTLRDLNLFILSSINLCRMIIIHKIIYYCVYCILYVIRKNLQNATISFFKSVRQHETSPLSPNGLS